VQAGERVYECQGDMMFDCQADVWDQRMCIYGTDDEISSEKG
jgi:hypothetical protein